MRGNYGAAQVLDKAIIDKTVAADKIWKSFAADITQIAEFKNLAEKPGASIPKKEISYVRDLYETLLSKPHGAEHALIFAVINATRLAVGKKATALDGANLARKWGLSRKMFALLKDAVSVDSDAYVVQRQIIAMVALCDVAVSAKTDKAGAYQVFDNLFSDKEAYVLTGLNTYNNVRWFRKEEMEAMLQEAALAQGIVHYKKAGFEKLAAFNKVLEKYVKEAEYNADALLKLLEPVKPKAKKTKAAASKTAKTAKPKAAKAKTTKAKAETKTAAKKPAAKKPAAKKTK